MPKFRLTPRFCFFLALAYYSLLITSGRFTLLAPVGLGMTFNSMLSHLLNGQFDVDPGAIRGEAYVRDGKTFAYFGIFPALLRLPLLPAGWLLNTDVTILSCVVAASVTVYFKVAMVTAIQEKLPATRLAKSVFGAVIMAMVFGGQVQFLKPSIFQEVGSWAGAIAAAYVYVVFRSLVVRKHFAGRTLAVMSLLAGLALLTRVSTGVGLYVSTALLLLVVAWRTTAFPVRERITSRLVRLSRLPIRPGAALAGGILLSFMILVGAINYGRWGDPLTFADLRLNLQMQAKPTRMERLIEHGELNVRRIWFDLLYYFVPINMSVRSDGKFLFQEFQDRMVDPPELPASSFFVSDPMLIVLFTLAIWLFLRFKRLGDVNVAQTVGVMVGLLVPVVIVCMAIYLAFRYRIDFYPFLDMGAFCGLYAFASEYERLRIGVSRKISKAIEYSAFAQIAMSHVLLIAYITSPFGDPARTILPHGLARTYLWSFLAWLRSFGL